MKMPNLNYSITCHIFLAESFHKAEILLWIYFYFFDKITNSSELSPVTQATYSQSTSQTRALAALGGCKRLRRKARTWLASTFPNKVAD